MIFSCRKYKGKIEPNTLYSVDKTQTIMFCEKHEDTDDDIIKINFNLKDSQYGIFANEYRPGFLKETKKADILLLAVDEPREQCSSWIFDVKATVGGEDVITHLIEQWQASYRHKQTLVNYLPGYAESETIGVITRDYQTERIEIILEDMKNTIYERNRVLAQMPSSSIVVKEKQKVLNLRKTYELFERFLHGYVEIMGREYPITVYLLERQATSYCCNIDVSC